MAIINWPETLRPSSLDWGQEANTVAFTSPFTGASQTASFPGTKWTCTMTFAFLDDDEARELEAIMFGLEGMQGRVRIRDYGRVPPVVKGNPVVNAAAQMGKILTTRGWTASTKVLRKGDYISVDNEMKMVTADVTSASDGSATIAVTPAWRKAPAQNAKVEVALPGAVFRLKENSTTAKRKPAFDNSFTLEFVEHIYAN